jgi:hypothetical protein
MFYPNILRLLAHQHAIPLERAYKLRDRAARIRQRPSIRKPLFLNSFQKTQPRAGGNHAGLLTSLMGPFVVRRDQPGSRAYLKPHLA